MRREFPDAPPLFAPGFQNWYWRQSRLGYGRPRPALTQLRVKMPKHLIEPLSVDDVARFWSSFRTSRDLAIVGLMLLHGLRSCEVLALNREDIQFPDSQIRVPGKGKKIRMLPLDRDSVKLLDHYLCLERPPYCGQALFVCLKAPSRGNRITSAGLRSLFRHHRQTTGVTKANPHRFRHTFAADMLRAGVSLPALMQPHGSCTDSNHHGLPSTHLHRTSGSNTLAPFPSASGPFRRCSREAKRIPLPTHPLTAFFRPAAESVTTSLGDASITSYRGTVMSCCFCVTPACASANVSISLRVFAPARPRAVGHPCAAGQAQNGTLGSRGSGLSTGRTDPFLRRSSAIASPRGRCVLIRKLRAALQEVVGGRNPCPHRAAPISTHIRDGDAARWR